MTGGRERWMVEDVQKGRRMDGGEGRGRKRGRKGWMEECTQGKKDGGGQKGWSEEERMAEFV